MTTSELLVSLQELQPNEMVAFLQQAQIPTSQLRELINQLERKDHNRDLRLHVTHALYSQNDWSEGLNEKEISRALSLVKEIDYDFAQRSGLSSVKEKLEQRVAELQEQRLRETIDSLSLEQMLQMIAEEKGSWDERTRAMQRVEEHFGVVNQTILNGVWRTETRSKVRELLGRIVKARLRALSPAELDALLVDSAFYGLDTEIVAALADKQLPTGMLVDLLAQYPRLYDAIHRALCQRSDLPYSMLESYFVWSKVDSLKRDIVYQALVCNVGWLTLQQIDHLGELSQCNYRYDPIVARGAEKSIAVAYMRAHQTFPTEFIQRDDVADEELMALLEHIREADRQSWEGFGAAIAKRRNQQRVQQSVA